MRSYYITVFAGNEPIGMFSTRPIPFDRAERLALGAMDRRIPATSVTLLDMRTGRNAGEYRKNEKESATSPASNY